MEISNLAVFWRASHDSQVVGISDCLFGSALKSVSNVWFLFTHLKVTPNNE
jgi:hypothetical protein